ncbi:lITAF domain-containing protein [Chanos chanos]|uniref:LITAF domain-containing protein n=1 Tax=Chanos chanos TaxID=29144 RepID=A0A6J2WMT5_CHACN|nr:lipopolysaccharide-induced tumor necrosis factor-alpha factor homolog [Chanos chanos]
MSADGTGTPPPYALPDEGKVDAVKPYHVHTPFTPPASAVDGNISQTQAKQAHSQSSVQTNKFVSYETELGRNPGMTTCVTCQQQVLTNVQYKVGAYAWLMCILFILCGLVIGCCLIPFFVKFFKDVYHTCPRCNQVLHVEKKSCC